MKRSGSFSGQHLPSHLPKPVKRSGSLERESLGAHGAQRIRSGDMRASIASRSKLSFPNSSIKRSGIQSVLGSAQRRTSFRGLGQKDSTTKDPRSVTDRSFKDRSIADLIEFLSMHQYPHMMSQKMFSSPSNSDFKKVFEFLVNFLIPNFKLGPKLEEDVPRVLKELGYPISITKSHLYTVGVPHTWPMLLAAISWLLNLIQTGNRHAPKVLPFPQLDDDFSLESEKKVFFEYCRKSYKVFLDGADEFTDERDEMERKLVTNSDVQEEVDKMEREVKKNQLILQDLLSNPSTLNDLNDQLSELKLDLNKLERYAENLDQHRRDAEMAAERLSNEEQQQIAELEALESTIRRKEDLHAKQKMTGIDAQGLNNEFRSFSRQLAVREKEIQEMNQEIHSLGIRFAKEQETVQTINKESRKLLHFMSINDDIFNLNDEITEEESRRWQTKVKPALYMKNQECLDCFRKSKVSLEDAKDALEQLNEVYASLEERSAAIASENSTIDQKIDAIKENHKAFVSATQSKIDLLNASIRRSSLHPNEARQLLEKEKEEFEHQRKIFTDEQNALARLLKDACREMLEHKRKVQELFGHVNNNVLEALERLKEKDKE